MESMYTYSPMQLQWRCGYDGLERPSMYVATTMEAYERRDVAERSDISPGLKVRLRLRDRVRGFGVRGLG